MKQVRTLGQCSLWYLSLQYFWRRLLLQVGLCVTRSNGIPMCRKPWYWAYLILQQKVKWQRDAFLIQTNMYRMEKPPCQLNISYIHHMSWSLIVIYHDRLRFSARRRLLIKNWIKWNKVDTVFVFITFILTPQRPLEALLVSKYRLFVIVMLIGHNGYMNNLEYIYHWYCLIMVSCRQPCQPGSGQERSNMYCQRGNHAMWAGNRWVGGSRAQLLDRCTGQHNPLDTHRFRCHGIDRGCGDSAILWPEGKA